MKLNNEELLLVSGGSAALVTAVIKIFTTIMEFGKMVGTAIRRGSTRNYC